MKKSNKLQALRERDSEAFKKPSLFQGAHWVHFDRYELIRFNGVLYISPAIDAEPIRYRPFNEPNILVDYLTLGQFAVKHMDEWEKVWREALGPLQSMGELDQIKSTEGSRKSQTDMAKLNAAKTHLARVIEQEDHMASRILPFVTKYGLLGLFFDRIVHEDKEKVWAWESRIMLTQAKRGTIKEMEYAQFARDYFPRGSIPAKSDSGRRLFSLYGERVHDIAIKSIGLWAMANQWERFIQSQSLPDAKVEPENENPEGITWRDIIEGNIRASNIGISIVLDEPRKIQYRFSSLASALETMLVLNIGSVDSPVKICRAMDCGRPFLAKNLRSLYCSSSCLSRDKVRKWRADKRTKTVVKTEGEFLGKQGKTRGK